MFPSKLLKGESDRYETTPDPEARNYRLGDYGYGKECVKIMALVKNGPVHSMKEFEVTTHLKLDTFKEYYKGDNSDIVGSDVQENTIFILARKFGIKSPEDFAIILASHFMNKYQHVREAHIHIEECPWERLGERESKIKGGAYSEEMHNHAFIYTPISNRYCDVIQKRNEPPIVISGIKGLRLMKTSNAPFVEYMKDEFRLIGDETERVLHAIVDGKWEYSTTNDIDFCTNWNRVKDIILKTFAGDAKTGIVTTSVQYNSYKTEKAIMDAIPQIASVSIQLPKRGYIKFDFGKFPSFTPPGKNPEIYFPEQAHGVGYARLDRV